ncbi:hypothetical protein HMPREF1210_03363 [Paenisporosarcina sp. HGH0030]|uniref:HTH-like domain-containing protein n=1 Tax=Paenisporosarcina sp. HGH0030 TaxID=1078085 RepID=UPI00034E9418|nr:hypothetical protein [Paenisporosarcina sp. HGH0030]EPD49464.1 hypothetical protein HMPREF1210_03363 [Paenisporosarcina sp. HGH0030]
MTEKQLGEILSQMYMRAPEGYKVTFIHLFGIKYAEEIIKNKLSIKKILEYSNVKPSFVTEISKGIKLSRYVTNTIN